MSASFVSWKKYIVLETHINTLRVKDKRYIFQLMRSFDGMSHDTFFPEYGITAGEFSMFQVIVESVRKRDGKAIHHTPPPPPPSGA